MTGHKPSAIYSTESSVKTFEPYRQSLKFTNFNTTSNAPATIYVFKCVYDLQPISFCVIGKSTSRHDVKKNKSSNCCHNGKMQIQQHLLHTDEFKAWLMPVINSDFEVYCLLWKRPIKLGMLGIRVLGLHLKHVATVNGLRHMMANSQFYCSRFSPSTSKLLGGDTAAL